MAIFKRIYRRKINGKVKTKTVYYIDYYINGRRKREAIGSRKKLAEEVLAKRKTEITEGKYRIQRKKPDITFNELAEEFINDYSKVNKKSWKRDVLSMKSLNLFFGRKGLREITPSHIQKYKKMRKEKKKLKLSTINRELSCLKTAMNYAIKCGYIEQNVSRLVKLFPENNRRLVFLTVDEIHRFVAACPDYFKPFVIVALSTGMRRGELIGLKWKDIDLDNNIIYLENPKSGKSEEVNLDDDLKRYLIDLRKKSSLEYVFINSKGRPYKDVRTVFKSSLRKAKIKKNITNHSLRHTFGAHHAMIGTPLPTLMKYMRHRSIEMTMRYAHLSPRHIQQRANIYQRRLGIVDKHNLSVNKNKEDGHCIDTLNKENKIRESVNKFDI